VDAKKSPTMPTPGHQMAGHKRGTATRPRPDYRVAGKRRTRRSGFTSWPGFHHLRISELRKARFTDCRNKLALT